MRSLLPQTLPEVDPDYLLSRYGSLPSGAVRFNFISSIDGSAQVKGLSGPLGTAADHLVFTLLRRLASVILVGSGTIHAEGYDGELLEGEDQAWRRDHGYSSHPPLAIVSNRLTIQPQAPVITRAPGEVIIYTGVEVDEQLRARYPEHVQLVEVPLISKDLDARAVVEDLRSRGMTLIHAEGGPTLLGQFIAQDLVDSLCLSISPVLVGGSGSRISAVDSEHLRAMELYSLLEEESMLLAEYRRQG